MEIGGFSYAGSTDPKCRAPDPTENALIISNLDFEKDTHGVQKDVEK